MNRGPEGFRVSPIGWDQERQDDLDRLRREQGTRYEEARIYDYDPETGSDGEQRGVAEIRPDDARINHEVPDGKIRPGVEIKI